MKLHPFEIRLNKQNIEELQLEAMMLSSEQKITKNPYLYALKKQIERQEVDEKLND